MNFRKAFRAFFQALKGQEEPLKIRSDASPKTHITLLQLVQSKSRLLDFLKEDLSSYSDEDIGAAVRKIHEDSARAFEEYVCLRPVLDENEGEMVTIPQGYDVEKVKLTGKVKGEGPYKGIVTHKGWRAQKTGLPGTHKITDIIQQAEVEIQ